jgi:hypothetical protein
MSKPADLVQGTLEVLMLKRPTGSVAGAISHVLALKEV